MTIQSARLNLDIACAVALGVVEHPCVNVNYSAIVFIDPDTRSEHKQSDWLDCSDPLHRATQDYLEARIEVLRTHSTYQRAGWSNIAAVKSRELATKRANDARGRAVAMLQERKVVDVAKSAGFNVLG